MNSHLFSFTASIRIRNNDAALASWRFVTVPAGLSTDLRNMRLGSSKHGFGEIKVQVRIGFITRTTQLFRSKDAQAYLLPIKKDIRTQLKVQEHDNISIECIIIKIPGNETN